MLPRHVTVLDANSKLRLDAKRTLRSVQGDQHSDTKTNTHPSISLVSGKNFENINSRKTRYVKSVKLMGLSEQVKTLTTSLKSKTTFPVD